MRKRFQIFCTAFTGLEAKAVNERQAPLRVTNIETSRIISTSLDLEREKDLRSFAGGKGNPKSRDHVVIAQRVASRVSVIPFTLQAYLPSGSELT